jgi:signal transduction histidine kinase
MRIVLVDGEDGARLASQPMALAPPCGAPSSHRCEDLGGGGIDFAAPMSPEDQQRRLEREQTDESLRVEREKADQTLDDSAIDETADAVISRARDRADELLAAARAKTDRASALRGAPVPTILTGERAREDQVLQQERATADQVLREERAEHLALLSRERQETDKDLSHERELSDGALATRDEFLAIVSHDLRNLLNGLVGSAALIEKSALQTDLVEQVVTHARRIQRAGARMNRLIGDLVDVASIEAGVLAVTREVADPTAVVTEAVDTFQVQTATAGVSVAAEIVRPVPLAAFDAARILQVLTNLLSNAIKFTPPPGKIVVHVERVGDEIRFAVSDTGVGIAADKLEAVFVRFLQVAANDRRGIGLGLYISKAIVQGHGGRIWAESQVGRGSTFCFTLPIHVGE